MCLPLFEKFVKALYKIKFKNMLLVMPKATLHNLRVFKSFWIHHGFIKIPLRPSISLSFLQKYIESSYCLAMLLPLSFSMVVTLFLFSLYITYFQVVGRNYHWKEPIRRDKAYCAFSRFVYSYSFLYKDIFHLLLG